MAEGTTEGNVLTVWVQADVSEFVRAGAVPHTRELLHVELGSLSAEDRAVLARHLYRVPNSPDVLAAVEVPGQPVPISVPAPTVDGLLQILRRVDAEQAAARAAAARRQAEYAARTRAAAERVLVERETRLCTERTYANNVGMISWQRVEPNWPLEDKQEWAAVAQAAEAREWQAELDARNAAAYQAALAHARAERDRKRAREQEFRVWAGERGSERVRLLLAENHPAWLKLAAAEWLNAHTPAGYAELDALMSRYAVVAWGERERTTPTVEDIIALRAARALVDVEPDHLRDPEMAWIATWRDATDNDDPDDVDEDGQVAAGGISVIRLTVVAPTGAFRNVYRPVES